MAELSNITAKITDLIPDTLEQLPQEGRLQALTAARKLVQQLEKPNETIRRWACEIQPQQMSIRVAIDLKLFHIISQQEKAISAAELAAQSNAEELLIIRLMRALTSIGFATEAGAFSYQPTTLTKSMTVPALEALYMIVYEDSGQINPRLHEYFKVKGYKCPTEYQNSAFQWVHSTPLGYFEWLHQRPALAESLNVAMTGVRGLAKYWADWYPVNERLINGFGAGPEDTLLVDIGGGKGHDVEAFLERFPSSAGHLVLQDLPEVVDTIPSTLQPGITVQAHDFFQLQPVKGARVYFTHFVFHDWPDSKASEILLRLKEAMRPGYSKLLLNESILPDQNCSPYYAAMDINMMCILAGIERSRTQWTGLIESAGLYIERIWNSPEAGNEEGIIEVVLRESETKSHPHPISQRPNL